MRNLVCLKQLCIGLLFLAMTLQASSTPEMRQFVTNALERVVLLASDAHHEGQEIISASMVPNSWSTFLGSDGADDLCITQRKNAFDDYLNSLGSTNCKILPAHQQRLIGVAISQCECLCYTNSTSSLRALALNPNGVCREEALTVALKFSSVDDGTTSFVEDVFTNNLSFGNLERGSASGIYAKKLLTMGNATTEQNEFRRKAVLMFYKHRQCGVANPAIIDDLFVSFIDGYASSSNRFDFSCFVLSHPDCLDVFRGNFNTVTNRLLSSGQPLRWINIGGANE